MFYRLFVKLFFKPTFQTIPDQNTFHKENLSLQIFLNTIVKFKGICP